MTTASREAHSPVSVGVVGLGWWGRTLIEAIDDCPELKVVAVVARSSEAISWAGNRGLGAHASAAKLLEDSRVEAVIIATPNATHRELSVMAAAAGRHVFCEKPLALTQADAVATIQACQSAGVVLSVGHEIRFEPAVGELLALARSGRLGSIVQLDAILSHDFLRAIPDDHWRLSIAEAPAGPLTATGIHMVDLSVALLGRPCSTNAHLHLSGPTGTLSVLATFACGASALIGASAVTPFHMRLAAYGTCGWAEAAASPNPDGQGHAWTLTTSIGKNGWATTQYPGERGIRANLGAFATAIKGLGSYPMSTDEMVDTIAFMEAIVRSAGRSGETEIV